MQFQFKNDLNFGGSTIFITQSHKIRLKGAVELKMETKKLISV